MSLALHGIKSRSLNSTPTFWLAFMQMLLIWLVKLSVYVFFSFCKRYSDVKSLNANRKFNFANDSVLFSAWLFPRAEKWRRRQARD